MRKLVALAAVAVLIGVGCAQEEDDLAASPSPEATATQGPASTAVNDHGTKTFTDESFSAEIELDNFYFEPTFIKSPGDATAKIELHNEGSATHTFTVDALDVDEQLEAGATKEVTVVIGTETRYEFYCRFHKDQGMRGAFQPH
jgi:plastocyanin